jgi:H+-translocating NAD(P) transhydrogenase subunit alpha
MCRVYLICLLALTGPAWLLNDAALAQSPFAQSLPAQPPRVDHATRTSETAPVTTHSLVQRPSLLVSVTIFVLAIFLGVELIRQVPATLHTPLMSGSNAISGITVVGALIAAGAAHGLGPPIAFVAIVLAMINVVGGFLVTDRMLRMFKRK